MPYNPVKCDKCGFTHDDRGKFWYLNARTLDIKKHVITNFVYLCNDCYGNFTKDYPTVNQF